MTRARTESSADREESRVDLSLTESQEMLRSSARTFVEREAPRHMIVALQGAESSLVPELWRKACEAGWLGILVPAEYGGSESSLTDAAVLYEELGRGPLPGPFFSSGVLGALTADGGGERGAAATPPAAAWRVARRCSRSPSPSRTPPGGRPASRSGRSAWAIATGSTARSSS